MRRVVAAFALVIAFVAARAPGAGTPVAPAPVSFSASGIDDAEDLHGSLSQPDLVIFAGGNQYMVMPALIAAFRARYPSARRIFYETLPPGIEARQYAVGLLAVGNLDIDARADVLLLNLRRMRDLRAKGGVSGYSVYAANTLAIEVAPGNPKHVESLLDLGRDDVRVAMPNPRWEGVALQIEGAYRRAGGHALVAKIMHDKLARGTTILTQIHHRQTPRFLLDGRADAGCVWVSEALEARRIHSGIETVAIPAALNVTGYYSAAVAPAAPHVALARAFVAFLSSPSAEALYRRYGFIAPVKGTP